MRRSSLITGLYLLVLFFSGVAVGGLGVRLYTLRSVSARNPEDFKNHYIAALKTRLKLSDDQVKQLGPILDETRRRHHELMEKHRPEIKAIQDEQVAKIRAILTDPQRAEYSKLLEERENQRQHQHP